MKKNLIEITLDFETYYDMKSKFMLLNKNRGLTIEQYIRDKRFEIIGLAVKVEGKPSEWLAPHEIQDWLDHIEVAYGWDNVRLIAHNARFDAAILSLRYNINPAQLADTLSMSRAIQQWDGYSLKNVTKELREKFHWGMWYNGDKAECGKLKNEEDFSSSEDKGDEVYNADGKHLFDFTDEEYDAYANYAKKDVDLTWSAFRFLMDEYNYPEEEIEVLTIALEMYTYPVIELDRAVLEEVRKDVNSFRQASLDKAGITLEEVRSDAKFADALRSLGVEPPTKINTKGETKYAFAKKDLAFLALLEHENSAVRELAQARFDNKSSQAVTRVEDFIAKSERGLACIGVEYYGARTGRFSGVEGNYQNLNRNVLVSKDTKPGQLVFYNGKADRFVSMVDEKVYLAKHGLVDNDEDLLHVVGLRDSLKAPKGKVLVVNDLAQVEARCLSYLAGEQWVLDAFVAKKDIYKATASRSFGVPYEEVTKAQRFVGKSQVLGLGYQAGVNGLKVVLGKRAEEFDDSELQMWVNSYRASVPNIVNFWKQGKNVLKAMVSGTNVPFDKHGHLTVDGNTIIAPNGMRFVYRDLHIVNEDGYDKFVYWGRNVRTKKPDWEYTFQGRIVENITQGFARIILTTQMMWIKDAFKQRGWTRDDAHLAMQVHDELIVCCKEEIAEEVFEIMQHFMGKTPSWCQGLPLGSDGDIAKRYGAAK